MHEREPPTTRSLLERIAATLNVSPSAFFGPECAALPASEPTPAECDEVVLFYRRIADPDRRAAVLRLLREMAAKP